MTARFFLGFERARGRPGVRNRLLLLNVTGLTDPATRRIAAALRDALVVSNPSGGGLLGEDTRVLHRCQRNLALNPNVGAVLVLGADPERVETLASDLARDGQRVEAVSLDDCGHDVLTFADRALRRALRLLVEISEQPRRALPLSDLCLGLECGRSDPTSGIAANPLVGAAVDRLVEAGGAAVFGETIEWLGCEAALEARAADPALAPRLAEAVLRRERLAVEDGVDLLGRNPNPTNVRAGLSTIEEKAIGALAKTGRGRIDGLLGYGEAVPPGPGLHAMDAAAATPESLTGFAAAGAQIVLFTTGVGNSFVNGISPTIKISANPTACRTLTEQIDFPCAELIAGTLGLAEAAAGLERFVLAVASGRLTFGEALGDSAEVVSRHGPSL